MYQPDDDPGSHPVKLFVMTACFALVCLLILLFWLKFAGI